MTIYGSERRAFLVSRFGREALAEQDSVQLYTATVLCSQTQQGFDKFTWLS